MTNILGRKSLFSGLTKVTTALSAPRLEGRAIYIDPSILTDLTHFRAECYATFFAGRRASDNPISRTILTTLTGLCEDTQRRYEQLLKVNVTRSIALGAVHRKGACSPNSLEEVDWKRQGTTFLFTDSKGHVGNAGATYVVWDRSNRWKRTLCQSGQTAEAWAVYEVGQWKQWHRPFCFLDHCAMINRTFFTLSAGTVFLLVITGYITLFFIAGTNDHIRFRFSLFCTQASYLIATDCPFFRV